MTLTVIASTNAAVSCSDREVPIPGLTSRYLLSGLKFVVHFSVSLGMCRKVTQIRHTSEVWSTYKNKLLLCSAVSKNMYGRSKCKSSQTPTAALNKYERSLQRLSRFV
jgi:hypothetical protein